MNKRKVEENMEKAVEAVNSVFSDGKVDKSMRSKMSAFGAAVMMSGKKSALAYYNKNEKKIIDMLLSSYDKNGQDAFKFLIVQETDDLLERSVALKLALNLFIKDNDKKDNNDGSINEEN